MWKIMVLKDAAIAGSSFFVTGCCLRYMKFITGSCSMFSLHGTAAWQSDLTLVLQGL
jgi:hypothetical protein